MSSAALLVLLPALLMMPESDGDDTLAFEMDRLHRSCRRLIWLNPLLRFAGFEAKAKGIRTMVPHVDELRPIHNLETMTDLTLTGGFTTNCSSTMVCEAFRWAWTFSEIRLEHPTANTTG